MTDWFSDLALKLFGASTGSGIAVLFAPGRDSKLTLLFRFMSGMWVGGVATDFAIAHLDWMKDSPTMLFVASGLGVTGYLFIQAILAPKTKDAVKSAAKRLVERYSGVKNES